MGTDGKLWWKSLSQQFTFHLRETSRLLELARGLSAEQLESTYGHGGLMAIGEHLLGSDAYWRGVLSGTPDDTGPQRVNDLDDLLSWNRREQTHWERWLAGLDDDWLRREADWTLTFGVYRFAPGDALQHLILHGHQHHGEIAHLLTKAGLAPGDVDYFDFFVRRQ